MLLLIKRGAQLLSSSGWRNGILNAYQTISANWYHVQFQVLGQWTLLKQVNVLSQTPTLIGWASLHEWSRQWIAHPPLMMSLPESQCNHSPSPWRHSLHIISTTVYPRKHVISLYLYDHEISHRDLFISNTHSNRDLFIRTIAIETCSSGP